MKVSRLSATALWLVLVVLMVGCGARMSTSQKSLSVQLRLGYFPNITHAPALVGVEEGFFDRSLGKGVEFELFTFNGGPDVVQSIFSGALDASYVGPNPAINAFVQSKGSAIRVIAGAASGGAALVVREGIKRAQDLKGTKIASPQLGNTQDVALRAWLKEQGLSADFEGGGDVSVAPQANAQILETFRAKVIDGAWVPEPWASRMIFEGGGHTLVDERDLWRGGRFVTAHLIVATAFLEKNPDVVRRLLEGHIAAIDLIEAEPEKAKRVGNRSLEKITGKGLSAEILDAAWQNLTFTTDPIADSLRESAADAVRVGLLESADLAGIYDLGPLNELLRSGGKAEVSS